MNSKTIIVTGAAGALGTELCLAASSEGFETVMLDCDRRGLEAAYDRITDAGLHEPALHPMDLATAGPDEIDQMLETVAAECGGLDGVIHCAARFEGLTPLDHFSPPEWLMHMQVNLNAAWLLSVRSLPLLRESDAGRLYFMLEDLPRLAGPFWGAYGVSKHALHALVGQFAAECKSSGVQVLGINPGPLRSALRSRAYHSESPASQPDPKFAADQIVGLLKGEVQPDGNYVDLSGN